MKLMDHPNIARYDASYESKDAIYHCIEYCRGNNLSDVTLSEAQASRVVHKLLLALDHCHNLNIIHRDVKPSNIMYDEKEEEVKLIDFGLSTKDKWGHKETTGTLFYLAPEVLSNYYGKECDIWSVGACLYTLLVGKSPFHAETYDEVYSLVLDGKYK
jgi:calcium-dependent protein kinase